MDLIIIAGMPTLEKTTVTAAVSKAFGYPMLEKDYLKEGLFDILGSESYAQKRDLDCAVDEILIRVSEALLRAGSSVIIDNNFDTAGGEKFRRVIEKYTPKCVTVFLNGEAPCEGGSPGDTAAGETSDEKVLPAGYVDLLRSRRQTRRRYRPHRQYAHRRHHRADPETAGHGIKRATGGSEHTPVRRAEAFHTGRRTPQRGSVRHHETCCYPSLQFPGETVLSGGEAETARRRF